MPASLALALHTHSVVVVSLYTPGASVDAMATDEAKHGAGLAGAGFVSFNVADDRLVAPLSSLLTAAPTPQLGPQDHGAHAVRRCTEQRAVCLGLPAGGARGSGDVWVRKAFDVPAARPRPSEGVTS